jgi:sterol desaturase/sphingolipid hydroxylase (fatty acid hydroxylase superfamily)
LPEESQDCVLFPTGYKVTHSQWLIVYILWLGPFMILAMNTLYAFIYWLELPFFEQYKVRQDVPWPWKTDPEEFFKLAKKGFIVCMFNNIFTNFLVLVFYSWVYNWQISFVNTDPTAVPSPLTLFKQCMVCLVCEDFVFHISHRILHTKHKYFPLYQKIHK